MNCRKNSQRFRWNILHNQFQHKRLGVFAYFIHDVSDFTIEMSKLYRYVDPTKQVILTYLPPRFGLLQLCRLPRFQKEALASYHASDINSIEILKNSYFKNCPSAFLCVLRIVAASS